MAAVPATPAPAGTQSIVRIIGGTVTQEHADDLEVLTGKYAGKAFNFRHRSHVQSGGDYRWPDPNAGVSRRSAAARNN